jgi:hypothetical protein
VKALTVPAPGPTKGSERWSGATPAEPATVRLVPSGEGTHSTAESASVISRAASHSCERAAALSVSRASWCETSATAAMPAALSSADSAWRRARRTSVSMNTPATTSVATVVSQRATGAVPGSSARVSAKAPAAMATCAAAAGRLKK